jgi:hypothetical protein
MKHPYLSDAWFQMHDAALSSIGSRLYNGNVVNFTITHRDGELELSLHDGAHRRGHDPRAPITITMPPDVAYSMSTGDPSAMLVGAANGTVLIEGDISALTMMSSKERAPALQRALDTIMAQTAPPDGQPTPAQVAEQKRTALERLGGAMRAEARALRDAKRANAMPKASPTKITKARAQTKPAKTQAKQATKRTKPTKPKAKPKLKPKKPTKTAKPKLRR